jgi:hypothetical protein
MTFYVGVHWECEWNYDKERMFFECTVLFFMDTNNPNLVFKQDPKLQWFQLTHLPMLDGSVANTRASHKLLIEYPGKHEVGLELASSRHVMSPIGSTSSNGSLEIAKNCR